MMQHKPSPHKQGFTLIELSIVLVIIGLITGGVLVGQDLIKISQARSQMADFQKFETATNTFKLKYNCLPGDCKNAISFGLGNDNGDGNRVLHNDLTHHTGYGAFRSLGVSGNHVARQEFQYFWIHLSEAGLIEGSYVGNASNNATDMSPHLPRDALGKNFLTAITIYGKTYIMTGATGVSAFGGYTFIRGNEALTTHQTRYIHSKVMGDSITIGAGEYDSFIQTPKALVTKPHWNTTFFSHGYLNNTGTADGGACIIDDGSGGHQFASEGFCNIAWQITY